MNIKKIGIVALSLVTAISLSGFSTVTQAATIEEITASINSLLATIASLQLELNALSGGGVSGGVAVSCTFTRNLYPEMSGEDVKCLQQYLNAAGHQVAATGVGSAGSETTYYGSLTTAAVMKWQDAAGISYGSWGGYFGPSSQAKYNAMAASGTGTGTGAIVVVPAGTGLVVSKASDSPFARTIGTGTAFNPALKVALTAGASNVSVNSVTLKKSGFLTSTNLNGVDVIDSSGTRHGNVITSIQADDTILITMTNNPIVVSAGTTEYITIRFNLLTGNYTGTVSFALQSISSDASSVNASFPILGATMNLVDGGSSLASTTLDVLTTTGSSTLSVDADSLQEITKFRIQEVGSKEGAYLHSLTLYNYGNAGDSDYKDVTLESQNGTVLATSQPNGQNIVFNLSSPYFIDKGQTKDFTVKAVITGGTTKSLQFVVYNNYDIDLRGASTGISVIPSAGSGDTSFPIGNGYNIQSIGSGTVTLTRASDSPSSVVVPGATSVTLARFNAKPIGENYELRQVAFYIATSTDAAALDLTGTVYVKVNGAIVYSVAASSVSNTTKTTVSLSSYPTLTSGVNNLIEVLGDISSSATTASTYKVTEFDLIQAKRLVTNDLVDPGTGETNGLTISVNAGSLIVTTLSTPVANSVVVGINDYEFATIQLNALASGEDVKVSRIIVTDSKVAGEYSHIANLLVYKDSETSPLPTSATTATNAATVTFNFRTPILVTKSTPVILHIKADVTNSTSTHTFRVASSSDEHVTAYGATTGNALTHGSNITFVGAGQAQAIVTAGRLTLSLLSGTGATPSVDRVMAVGSTDQVVLAFTLRSQFEEQKITSLKITASSTLGGSLATSTLRNIKLYEGSSATPFAGPVDFSLCASGVCTYTFTHTDNLLDNPVPNTGVEIYVKGDVGESGTVSLGDTFVVKIASTTGDISIKGATTQSASGTKTGSAGFGDVMYYTYVVPQTVSISIVSPTIAQTLGSSGNGAPAGQQLAVFKVTNNGSAAIQLATSTTWRFAQAGTTTSTFKVYIGNSAAAAITQLQGTATNTISNYVNFGVLDASAANRTITGNGTKYLVIKNEEIMLTGTTAQFSANAIGDLYYQVSEGQLGYSGNAGTGDTDTDDTIFSLPISGVPQSAASNSAL